MSEKDVIPWHSAPCLPSTAPDPLGYLAYTAQTTIDIADNGMCSSGRTVNCLKAMLGDDRHDLLFVGYQAEATVGRQTQHFGSRRGFAEIDGQRYEIRAQVHTIGCYSAPANRQGLVSFVTRMRR